MFKSLIASIHFFFTQAADLKANTTRSVSSVLPISQEQQAEAPRKITQEERDFSAFKTLRNAQSEARYVGVRAYAVVPCCRRHLETRPLTPPFCPMQCPREEETGGRGL